MASNNEFFSIESNIRTINNFIASLSTASGDEFIDKRNYHLGKLLSIMVANSQMFDTNCQFNIKHISNSFITSLINATEKSSIEIDDIFSMCYRFLIEFYLSTKDNLGIELEQVRAFVDDYIDSFQNSARYQLIYADRRMPTAILKDVLNNDDIQSVLNFNSTIAQATSLKLAWDKEVSEKEERVNSLKDSLEEFETAYNFVGLYNGFDILSTDKTKEKKQLFIALIIVGTLAVIPILTELYFTYKYLEKFIALGALSLLIMIPMLSLVIIFIYYFRVILFNYKSVKSQLLQIELRKTFCRFIQSYVKYASDIKSKDNELLNKFENIVFSGIVSDDEKLPSTFDGLEKIADFVKSLK